MLVVTSGSFFGDDRFEGPRKSFVCGSTDKNVSLSAQGPPFPKVDEAPAQGPFSLALAKVETFLGFGQGMVAPALTAVLLPLLGAVEYLPTSEANLRFTLLP
jgi:hypothetical protein